MNEAKISSNGEPEKKINLNRKTLELGVEQFLKKSTKQKPFSKSLVELYLKILTPILRILKKAKKENFLSLYHNNNKRLRRILIR